MPHGVTVMVCLPCLLHPSTQGGPYGVNQCWCLNESIDGTDLIWPSSRMLSQLANAMATSSG